jgi:hypothetical protein
MLFTERVVLGHHVSFARIKVDPTKVTVIVKLPPSATQKDVRSFLGHMGYYKHFLQIFYKTDPLFKLLTKDADFFGNTMCQIALDILKEKLSTTQVLRGLDWNLPFHISTNASYSTMGVVLGKKENIQTYAIYFISKKLAPTELNCTMTEKEFLAVVHAINKFRHYIIGYQFFFHTNHSGMRYLMNKPIMNDIISRWLLLL